MEANRPTGHRVNFNPLKMETKRHTGHRINFNPLKMETNRPTGHYTPQVAVSPNKQPPFWKLHAHLWLAEEQFRREGVTSQTAMFYQLVGAISQGPN